MKTYIDNQLIMDREEYDIFLSNYKRSKNIYSISDKEDFDNTSNIYFLAIIYTYKLLDIFKFDYNSSENELLIFDENNTLFFEISDSIYFKYGRTKSISFLLERIQKDFPNIESLEEVKCINNTFEHLLFRYIYDYVVEFGQNITLKRDIKIWKN